jgi:hypothetical protein
MQIVRSWRVLILAAALTAAACDEKLSDLTGPTPNLEPTFASIAQNIFQTTDSSGRVACTQCHTTSGGRVPPQGLSLDAGAAYANLVGVASRERPELQRVAPGNPDASYLVHKLEGRADIVGQRMPRTAGPFLTEGQLMVIRRWIALGAPNN